MHPTNWRIRKRSYKASSPSPFAGSSLDAAISAFRGTRTVNCPLRYIFSLITVKREFWIAGPAFHISSRKTIDAVGKYPFVIRSYVSSSFNFEMETGPNISSGVLKRDIRYSKASASLKASLSLRATKLLATPGGPNRKILSPAMADNRESAMVCSFSNTPSLRDFSSWVIWDLIDFMRQMISCVVNRRQRYKNSLK